MEQVMSQASAMEDRSCALDETTLLWTDDEELVTDLDLEQWALQHHAGVKLGIMLRGVAMLAAVVAALVGFLDFLRVTPLLTDLVNSNGKPRKAGLLPSAGKACK